MRDRCEPDVDSWGWFRGSGGSACIWFWGRGRGWRGGQGPPHVYVHTQTHAGLGLEDNSPFQDAAQAGSPSLLGREGKAPEYLSPIFSLLNRKMRLGSVP